MPDDGSLRAETRKISSLITKKIINDRKILCLLDWLEHRNYLRFVSCKFTDVTSSYRWVIFEQFIAEYKSVIVV